VTPRQIRIPGVMLLSEARGGHDLSSEVMGAYVRLLQYQDKVAYERSGCVAVKWRHYMEPYFAVCYWGSLIFAILFSKQMIIIKLF
jgi:hypothetical protein